MKAARRSAVAGLTLALALVGATGSAAASKDPVGRVVFARGTSLWLTDGKGKGPAVELATLPGPAADVRQIRTDATGTTILVDVAGRWFWARMPAADLPKPEAPPATLAELPCGAGAARLSLAGDCVVCASATGKTLLVRLDDGKSFARDLPGASIALTERDGKRELVWIADGAVRAAPIADRKAMRVVVPEAPSRGLVVAPDGKRAVGVYLAPPTGQPKTDAPRDQLFSFALDGGTARRRLLRDAVVLDWSWDSQWLLMQDGGKACVARAVGGEYKCWKGFTAVSLSPDGAWALVLGPRDGAAAPGDDDGGDDGPGEGEGGDDDSDDAGEATVALPTGPLSLYRARLPGTYTERPVLIERVVDGAAAWLAPAGTTLPPPAAPAAKPPAPPTPKPATAPAAPTAPTAPSTP